MAERPGVRGEMMGLVLVMALSGAMTGSAMADIADPFQRLGSGGCRTAEGGQGRYVQVRDVSLDACRAHCEDARRHDRVCYGIEYSRAARSCELHTRPVARASGGGGTASCYLYVCAQNPRLC